MFEKAHSGEGWMPPHDGRSFDDITEEEMRRIDYMLNERPLRCLNWRTPREAFAGLILRHMSDAV